MNARAESSVYCRGTDVIDGMCGSAEAWRTMARSDISKGRSTTGGHARCGTRSGGAKARKSNALIGG